MNKNYINKITLGACEEHILNLTDKSIDMFLSDIPYGINLDDWDVLHNNTNSALLGQSPAQKEKSGFKRRGKPINGWSKDDRNIGYEYQNWCDNWVQKIYPKMKEGSSLFVFGARRTIHRVINSFEYNGFLLKDILVWKKKAAHHRAQKLNVILHRRGLEDDAKKWEGWRLGNLAPIWEPIAWFIKPYKIGSTITDNVLENEIGGININKCNLNGINATNLMEFGFNKNEKKIHEAQKPLNLIKHLIELTTIEGQLILDPFMGSGTTAVASELLNRKYIGFESNPTYHKNSLERLNNTLLNL